MTAWLVAASWVDRVTGVVARTVAWALLANALLIAGNAVMRKLFAVAWPVLFDLQWHFYAAVVTLMAAYTLQLDQHVRVDVLSSRLGERGRLWIDLVGLLGILLPVCAAVVWVTLPQAVHAFAVGETRASRESLSNLPAWMMKGLVPAGFLLLALQGGAEAIRCVAALRGVSPRPRRAGLLMEDDGRVS
ncbi:MAG: TRAP transporter small permease subunit [Aquincola sp.]|nr:TRAP transporter small permease subunit [Aquincola sp.]|tara:strand:- start:887 stop:1453 length:567 start_codon:yes stop_codon:yes gene_type:complete